MNPKFLEYPRIFIPQESGHPHPRRVLHEPEAPAALHQAHSSHQRAGGGGSAARRAHDPEVRLREHAAGRLRPQRGHTGRTRGKGWGYGGGVTSEREHELLDGIS